MIVLNLLNKEKGDINYTITTFSDSQKLLKIETDFIEESASFMIISRMSWENVQEIILAKKALDKLGMKDISLRVPYFLGARSDRSFSEYGINYLKDIICPIINSLNFSTVEVLDPHSNCLEMGLNNIVKINNSLVVEFALEDLYINHKINCIDLIWLIPDKGATDKAYNTIKETNFSGNVLECSKHRDIKTGEITSTTIPSEYIFNKEESCIIVDDICDGGKTFIELAKVAKRRGAGKVFLVVTHGIFSKGMIEISNYIDGIYCTSSFSDMIGEKIKQLKII